MIKFLLQKNDIESEDEYIIVKNILDSNNLYYEEITQDELSFYCDKKYIPIGNIEFVRKAIQIMYKSDFIEQPIEIPTYLQTPEFLKRTYKICKWNEIPRKGKWFIKDASKMKYFRIYADTEFIIDDEIFDYQPKFSYDNSISLPKSDDYIVSSPYRIDSEYRIYVIDSKIVNSELYLGTSDVKPDMALIEKAVELINTNEKWLKSYSLDVMVGELGTAIIEIHNFSAIGLYNRKFDKEILTAYTQGIEYYLNDNRIKYKE